MRLIILVFIAFIFFIPLTVIPTKVLSGGHEPKEWEGEGTKIEFQSIPMITMQKILNRGSYGETQTISGTLNFPANAPKKMFQQSFYCMAEVE